LDGLDDGVQFPLALPHCRPTQLRYTCTVNAPFPGGGPLFVNVWFDWNRNGDWNNTLQCPDGSPAPEWAVQNQLLIIPPGPYPVVLTNVTPPFRSWHPTIDEKPIWMRITLAEQPWPPPAGVLPQGGEGPSQGYNYGETEDYYVTNYQTAGELDFGDAPPPYPTLLAANGARHQVVPGFNLGNLIDAEANGFPHALAKGDDLNNWADEDGVSWPPTPPMIGSQACVTVSLTGPSGWLDAWIDFDKSGVWGDSAGEQIFASKPLVGGANAVCFPVPSTAKLGTNFARFRLSSIGALNVTGPWIDGEVEDYSLVIRQRRPATNIVITNITVTNLVSGGVTQQVATIAWNAESGLSYQLQAVTNLTGAPTNLWWTDVGGLVIGPSNTQVETNSLQFERYYRVTMPFVWP
jgi:hypothetical protein